jgi:hypothetical protein
MTKPTCWFAEHDGISCKLIVALHLEILGMVGEIAICTACEPTIRAMLDEYQRRQRPTSEQVATPKQVVERFLATL